MKQIYTSVLAMLLLLMAGCASVTKDIVIETETSPLAKLDSYNTYAWLGKMALLRDPDKKWQPPKMNISGDIKWLIDRELRRKGINNELTEPDLAAAFFVGVDMEAMQLKVDPETNANILKNVPKAALVVALIDTKTEYLVWIGKATAKIQNSQDVEVVRTDLNSPGRTLCFSGQGPESTADRAGQICLLWLGQESKRIRPDESAPGTNRRTPVRA